MGLKHAIDHSKAQRILLFPILELLVKKNLVWEILWTHYSSVRDTTWPKKFAIGLAGNSVTRSGEVALVRELPRYYLLKSPSFRGFTDVSGGIRKSVTTEMITSACYYGALASTTATAEKSSLFEKWIRVFSNFVGFTPIRWKFQM